MSAKKTIAEIRALDIDNAIHDLERDTAAAASVLQAAIITRSDSDVRVLVMSARDAVKRAQDVVIALRDLMKD